MKTVQLTRGKVALIDDADLPLVQDFKWYATSTGYAKNDRLGYMHRLFTDAPAGVEVDHINQNKLDNQRSNLRLCSRAQNKINCNRQKRGGVSGHPELRGVRRQAGSNDRWTASISIGGKLKYLGSFLTAADAAMAYDTAALTLQGEFAVLNFPKSVVG